MLKKQNKLVWNVIHESINRGNIEQWNVFNHGGFMKDVIKAFDKYKNDKEEFLNRVKSSAMYYYWSKCEWEVVLSNEDGRMVVTPWIGSHDIRLDVTDDENFDWSGFYNKMTERYVAKDASVKIDVYDQLMFMWEEFTDYLWYSLNIS